MDIGFGGHLSLIFAKVESLFLLSRGKHTQLRLTLEALQNSKRVIKISTKSLGEIERVLALLTRKYSVSIHPIEIRIEIKSVGQRTSKVSGSLNCFLNPLKSSHR